VIHLMCCQKTSVERHAACQRLLGNSQNHQDDRRDDSELSCNPMDSLSQMGISL
jgi:hypothetical protein